jgi:hypothetical protein
VLSRPIKLALNPLLMRIKLRGFQVPTKNQKGQKKQSLGILSLYALDYLSMKEGSFFCFVFLVMRSTEPGFFRSRSWCLWKPLTRRGAWAWCAKFCKPLLLRKVLCYGGTPERPKSKLQS